MNWIAGACSLVFLCRLSIRTIISLSSSEAFSLEMWIVDLVSETSGRAQPSTKPGTVLVLWPEVEQRPRNNVIVGTPGLAPRLPSDHTHDHAWPPLSKWFPSAMLSPGTPPHSIQSSTAASQLYMASVQEIVRHCSPPPQYGYMVAR